MSELVGRLQFQILEITITSAEVASLFILYLFFRLVIIFIACSMIQFRVPCSTSIAPCATKKKIRDFLSV